MINFCLLENIKDNLTLIFVLNRVKQSVQAMETCRRPKTNVYDLNQNTAAAGSATAAAAVMANFLQQPPAGAATSANLTLTFNNHINSLTSQVSHCL